MNDRKSNYATLSLTGAKRFAALLLTAAIVFTMFPARWSPFLPSARADTAPFNLAASNLTQNWTNVGLITANDDWSNVPSITGFLGQDITTSAGTDPQTLTGTSSVANDVDVIANQTNPNTLATGGVAEFDGITNPTVALQGSGTADAPHVILYLNTTGRQSVNVAYNLRDIDGSNDNAVQPVALQYRVGTTGNFTNLPAGFVADATTGPSIATQVTPVNVTLPAAANNQAQVQVRIITANAANNDEWVGVDDIVVSSAALAATPNLTVGDATLAEGNAGTTTFSFTVQLSSPAPAGGVTFDIATADGTATTADNDYVAQSLTGQTIPAGSSSYTFNVTVNGDTILESNETFFVNVNVTTGAIATDSQGQGTINNDDVAPPPNLSINDVTQAEGNVGISVFTFTVQLSSPAPVGGVTFDIATLDGTANAGTDYVGNSATALTIAAGETSRTFDVTVNGDAVVEPTETFFVNVGNVMGANVTDSEGQGNITNDDAILAASIPLVISEIRFDGPFSGPPPSLNAPQGVLANPLDEYIEIGNTTTLPVTVQTGDGSAGYAVVASDGVTRCVIPNGTIISAFGHYLCAHTGYSLSAQATPDVSYAAEINNDGTAGVALFNTANTANFVIANRIDAFGTDAATPALYREGANGINEFLSGGQTAFVRDLCGKGGVTTTGGTCPTAGVLKDSNDNAADFFIVDTSANRGTRGTPQPENLTSPIQRNAQVGAFLLDSTVPSAAFPNRQRIAGGGANQGTFGSLVLRRRFVNNTGAPISTLRFRIIDITTTPVPAGFADLRVGLNDVSATTVVGINDAATCAVEAQTPPCGVTVRTVVSQQEDICPSCGLNATLNADQITLAAPLPPGASVNLQFELDVEQTGNFRFFINIEALNNAIIPVRPVKEKGRPQRGDARRGN